MAAQYLATQPDVAAAFRTLEQMRLDCIAASHADRTVQVSGEFLARGVIRQIVSESEVRHSGNCSHEM
jgi:hypothetical protein